MGLLHSCLICESKKKGCQDKEPKEFIKRYIPFEESAGGSLTRYICEDCYNNNPPRNLKTRCNVDSF